MVLRCSWNEKNKSYRTRGRPPVVGTRHELSSRPNLCLSALEGESTEWRLYHVMAIVTNDHILILYIYGCDSA